MNKYICILLLASASLLSCKKNFLDKGPDEDLTIEKAFTDKLNTERFLTSVYAYLPREWFFADLTEASPFIGATDEMEVSGLSEFVQTMNSGSWNASSIPARAWGFPYRGIRQANIFLENVDRSPLTDEEKRQWSAEAIFLRAFYHYNLMKLFGPVVIADRVFSPEEDYAGIKRSPLDDCVNFVATECDKAAAVLPIKVEDIKAGRATKAAALALKARVLLHAASPLWNGNPDYVNFKDHLGTNLFPTSVDNNKWQLAADAAKACIDACEAGGYGLYRSAGNNPVLNYQELFTTDWSREVLYAYNYASDGLSGWPEKCGSPRSFGGWSVWNVSQQMVDEYEMDNGQQPITGYNSDGSPIINVASGYAETGHVATDGPANRWLAGTRNMYVRRDPRFYASIHYAGSFWQTRKVEFWKSGKDGQTVDGSLKSGYLIKKFSDPSADVVNGRFLFQTTNYFRLGEVYLNYAEALNEAQGAVADVYKYVNAIRNRAGMPDLPVGLSKEDMRTRIHHERRIELAFETFRYFDAHRWKTAPASESGPFRGLNVGVGTSISDNAFYERKVVETRVFQSRHYLWPIPQAEINKNQNIVQNPGW
jgi:hypothetical protein